MSSKMFPQVHPDFDKFNPDVIPQEWVKKKDTYDEDGRLHSHDDKPAKKVNSDNRKSIFLTWYNHGVIERADNQPSIVSLSEIAYTTYNAQNEEHSFNGNPSYFRKTNNDELEEEFWIEWSFNNTCHRDGGLPAKCHYAKNRLISEEYFTNGFLSRLGNLPAAISDQIKLWRVNGVAHNSNGPETEIYNKDGSLADDRYALYGIFMPKEVYGDIFNCHVTNEIPLWVAFLYKLGMITEENLIFIKSYENQKESNLPISWLIRYYGLNEQACREKLDQLKTSEKTIDFDLEMRVAGFLNTITNIVKLEEQNHSSSLNEEGKRHG